MNPENYKIEEYFKKYRAEVIGMCLAEYDEEEHISSEKEISFKKGKSEGITEGEIQSKANLIQRLMNEGMSFEESCRHLRLTDEEFKECKTYMDKHKKSK